jgi:hypothetical protein
MATIAEIQPAVKVDDLLTLVAVIISRLLEADDGLPATQDRVA